MQHTKKWLVFSVAALGVLTLIFLHNAAQASLLDWWNKSFPDWKIERPTPLLTAPDTSATKATPYESPDTHEEAVIKAVDLASPSVVSIIISKDLPVIENCPYDPFGNLPPEFRNFFGGGSDFTVPCQKGTQHQEVGGGSGFIISEDGLVLTNRHVVSDTKADYTVLMNDGKKYPAKVLARDPVQDLAVVKIEANNLKPLPLGDSDGIRLGQTAIAIGNALGEFRNTVSVGVVSGLARRITASDKAGGSEDLEGLIQTDTAINQGNSGGPLLNLRGEVIGITTAVASDAQNIGFALPINKAKRAITSVKASGKITVPYLGVRYLSVTDDIVKKEKLPVTYGALVRGGEDGPGVAKNSPAEKAGLQAEDIILAVNGVKVDENNSLGTLIQRYQVGETVKLTIRRGDKDLTISVLLEERQF